MRFFRCIRVMRIVITDNLEAAMACTKWFDIRGKRVLVYETPSETDFGIDPRYSGFKPNVFIDISGQLERKIELMNIYESEINEFPFPRSEVALRALAQSRGGQAGFDACEGFLLLRERICLKRVVTI